jgi:hypothetical protein
MCSSSSGLPEGAHTLRADRWQRLREPGHDQWENEEKGKRCNHDWKCNQKAIVES